MTNRKARQGRRNWSVAVEAASSVCARPRAQQAPNRLARPIGPHLGRFPTMLRPGTGALRQYFLPPSLTHYLALGYWPLATGFALLPHPGAARRTGHSNWCPGRRSAFFISPV